MSSTSRPTPTTSSSYFGSQYTSTTQSTDPYAPASAGQRAASLTSPMQTLDPYAPPTPAWNPYPEPQSSARSYSYQSQSKPSPLGSSGPRAASTSKPKPPQRVASTAYDPPFLRTQKSFARPASAASFGSGSYGLPASLAPPLPQMPPDAPPPGPPKRSQTPQVAPPPSIASAPAVNQAAQYDAYSPSIDAQSVMQPAGLAKGPIRPASVQSSRPPQRAPSYNSFDPPLRPQTISRPPSRAPQSAEVPLQQSPALSLLSPPSMPDSSFAAPERPSSRTMSARATPAFEAPPPTGPPRRSTPSFQPPPRSLPAASAVVSPPGPPSVAQHPAPSSQMSYPDQEALASPVNIQSSPNPVLHSGQEEPDEEGGGGDWYNDDELRNRPPVSHHREDPGPPDEEESVAALPSLDEAGADKPVQHRPPVQTKSSNYDQYAPPPSRSSAKSPREAYHPYRRASTTSPLKTRRDGYETYQPVEDDAAASTPPQTTPYDPYAPSAVQERPSSQSPRQSLTGPLSHAGSYEPYKVDEDTDFRPQQHNTYDPYAPSASQERPSQRAAQQPSSLGLSTLQHGGQNSTDAYAPPIQRSTGYMSETQARPHSQQIDQYAPPAPQSAYDPYAAPQNDINAGSHLRVASPGYNSEYGTSPPGNNYFSSSASGPADHTYTPQQVLDQKPLSEDPLGRSTFDAQNKPLAIFGFGGVLLTSFPGMANADNETLSHARTPSYGYASGRGQVWIRTLSEVVSESALKSSETQFPGPLVLDPTSTKTAATDKKKKDAVLVYLNSRAEEIEKGLPYLKTSANSTRREQEGKLVLIKVLIAMVTGDGRLSGRYASRSLHTHKHNSTMANVKQSRSGRRLTNRFAESFWLNEQHVYFLSN